MAPAATVGGAERALTALARALPDHGWDLHVACLNNGPLLDLLRDAEVSHSVFPAGRLSQPVPFLRTVSAIAGLTRDLGAPVLLGNMDKGQVYAAAAAKIARVPSLWWQHMIPGSSTFVRAANLFRPAAIVVGSTAAQSAQAIVTPNRRIVRIPPPVPVTDITRRAGSGHHLREQQGWTPEDLVVGVVGRLSPEKGHIELLHAIALLSRGGERIIFALVGDGAVDYRLYLQGRAEALGIRKHVFFAGYQGDPTPWIDAMDIVVVPSVESFGLTIVEAMSLSKPVIAVAAGGPLDIVHDGVDGILVPPRDPGALAEALERLVAQPALRSKLAAQGTITAQRFSDRRSSESFSRLLDTLADRRER